MYCSILIFVIETHFITFHMVTWETMVLESVDNHKDMTEHLQIRENLNCQMPIEKLYCSAGYEPCYCHHTSKRKQANKKKTKNKQNIDSLLFLSTLRGSFFSVGPFTKTGNMSKMCNLDNSCKSPYENWKILPICRIKSTTKFLHILKAFPNFSFVCFHWKITWHLGKVNKKV